jgi:hypothetical protein
MTVSRRESLDRLLAGLGIEPGDFLVFGVVPIGCGILLPLLAHDSVVAGFVALMLCAGTAANVAGRRSYSVWQSAWYTCVAIVSMFFWAIAFDVLVITLLTR